MLQKCLCSRKRENRFYSVELVVGIYHGSCLIFLRFLKQYIQKIKIYARYESPIDLFYNFPGNFHCSWERHAQELNWALIRP